MIIIEVPDRQFRPNENMRYAMVNKTCACVVEIVEETWRRPRVWRQETRRVDSKWQDSTAQQPGAS